jgi:predicted nucleic acid-binding protein
MSSHSAIATNETVLFWEDNEKDEKTGYCTNQKYYYEETGTASKKRLPDSYKAYLKEHLRRMEEKFPRKEHQSLLLNSRHSKAA